jgi:uncharacterized protein YggE
MVTVAGEGSASGVPDTALPHLGVETRGTTPGEALDACSRALDEVIVATRGAGVEQRRLATGELTVHPDWEAGPQGRQRLVGYRAAARLTARLEAPARAGPAAAGPAVELGEAEVQARVVVTWALLDGPQPHL